jgi:hypothetical protein
MEQKPEFKKEPQPGDQLEMEFSEEKPKSQIPYDGIPFTTLEVGQRSERIRYKRNHNIPLNKEDEKEVERQNEENKNDDIYKK